MTAIFLCVFVVQLFIYGIHEMSEQSFLPYSLPIHEATENWGPDSLFGHVLTYLLVIAPLTWLVIKKASVPKATYSTASSATR
jgi:high-affinity iron transporter